MGLARDFTDNHFCMINGYAAVEKFPNAARTQRTRQQITTLLFNELNLFLSFSLPFRLFGRWCFYSMNEFCAMVGSVMSMNKWFRDRSLFSGYLLGILHRTYSYCSIKLWSVHQIMFDFWLMKSEWWSKGERQNEKESILLKKKESHARAHIVFHYWGIRPGFAFPFSILLISMTRLTSSTIAFYIFNLMYDCLIFHPILLHSFSFSATTFLCSHVVWCTCVWASVHDPFSPVCMHVCTTMYSMHFIFSIHSSLCSIDSSVCLFACRLSVQLSNECVCVKCNSHISEWLIGIQMSVRTMICG